MADWKDILSRAYNQDGGNKYEKNNLERKTKFLDEVIIPAFEEMQKHIQILVKDIPIQKGSYIINGNANNPSLTRKLKNKDIEWSFQINYEGMGKDIYVKYAYRYKDKEPIYDDLRGGHIDGIDKNDILYTIAGLIKESRHPSSRFGGIHV